MSNIVIHPEAENTEGDEDEEMDEPKEDEVCNFHYGNFIYPFKQNMH